MMKFEINNNLYSQELYMYGRYVDEYMHQFWACVYENIIKKNSSNFVWQYLNVGYIGVKIWYLSKVIV